MKKSRDRSGLSAPIAVGAAAVLASLLTGALWSCGGDKPPQPRKTEAKGDYECLTTPNGIPRKVIVKGQEAYAFENYDFTGKRQPLKFFRKYFVFKEQPGKGYLVGEATVRDSTLGWVRREEVIPWNHEQALFFINKRAGARVPVKLWTDRRDVGRADAPYFEENLSVRETTEPFPILQKDGSALRVAFLWHKQGALQALPVNNLDVANAQTVRGEAVARGSDGAALTGGGNGALARARAGLRRMDIVLVMDVTSSMGPYMQAVKERMTRMVDQLAILGSADFPVESHIGVVAYRDYADAASSFTTRRLDLTTDRQSVYRFLAGLSPYSVGRDKYEAIFEGLSDAIDRKSWGTYSHRVVVLVGPAPPQGFTPAAVAEAGIRSESPFFAGTFTDNVQTIQRKIDDNGIWFYALGVGHDPEMEVSFRQIVGARRRGGFRSMAGADAFIAQLDAELRAQRQEQATSGKIAEGAISKIAGGAPASTLSDGEIEALIVRNIPPERIDELAQNRIQSGWFDAGAVPDSVSVCVYLRRRDLEATLMDLRASTKETITGQELEVLTSILAPHVGQESLRNVKNVNDLVKLVSDLPLPPEVVRRIMAPGADDRENRRVLTTKMNNIMILILQKELFNNYEEGWIPMEYLPGSLSREAK